MTAEETPGNRTGRTQVVKGCNIVSNRKQHSNRKTCGAKKVSVFVRSDAVKTGQGTIVTIYIQA